MGLIADVMGESWGRALSHYISEEVLSRIGDKVADERDKMTIYPERADVFKAFKLTPFDEVKVVMIGQDPYNTPGQATGLAFECGKSVSPSWAKILDVLIADYPKSFPGNLYEGKIEPWAKQGVLLMNVALTVRKSQPQSHIPFWKPFTVKIIDVLKLDPRPKAFVLLGSDAKKMAGSIPGPHYAFTYEHPAAAAYGERAWNAKGIFLGINKFLKDNGREPIEWDRQI